MLNATDLRIGSKAAISNGQLQRLGDTAWLEDLNYSSSEVALPKYSGMTICVQLVLNGSGGTLAPGAVCYWDVGTNGPGKEVDGIASVGSNHLPAGVVDPWISGTVANDTTFLLITHGPCKFLSTTGTAVVVGDPLTLGASGRVDKYAVASPDVTDNFHYCGLALEAVASGTASGTLFRGFFSSIIGF